MLRKLNKIQNPVYNPGKGKRIAVWVQACFLACNACVSES